jgi:hypothetical protein
MNTFSFTAKFDSEESCRIHFKEERDKLGVICKRCSHAAHYWIKSQWSYSVNSAKAEPLCEAELLCRVQIYHF